MQKEMLPYLQKIISLEQAAYVEGKVLDQMKKARQKVDTQKHVISEPVKPRRKSLFSSLIKEWGWFCGGLFIAIVVFVPMLVLTLAEEIGMVDLAPMLSLDKKGYIPLLIIVGLDVFVYLLISISDVSNTNQKLTEEYRKELARYPELVQNKEASYQRALRYAEYLDQLIAQQEKKLADTRRLLQEAYDKGLLYGKYRNFVAVCSICEYLESGRCSELGGPDGAYNLFEQEIRANMVITQLGSILSKLDRIQANQAMLYDAISTGNRLTSQLIEQTNESIRLGGVQRPAERHHGVQHPADGPGGILQQLDAGAGYLRTRQKNAGAQLPRSFCVSFEYRPGAPPDGPMPASAAPGPAEGRCPAGTQATGRRSGS